MNEDPVEMSETFDGYLMFDFSNFHGLMAQTFENPEEDVINERGLGSKDLIKQNSFKRNINVPGPYLYSPRQELERKQYSLYSLDKNGDDQNINYDVDEDDDYQDDDQCLLNLQNSEFNLLANLDFEPDEDAYENAMNLTGGITSQTLRVKTISDRHKKVSIFSPTMHYEDNQEIDKRIQMINIQNIELLKEEFNFDDFYKFLKGLEFLNFSNIKSNEDHIKIDQLITLVEIRIQFEKMCDMFQKWTQLTPSISFSSRLQFFHLQLDNFIDMVNYIIDNGAAKQKHFQPREGLLSMSQPTQQLPSQSLHDKPNQIQQKYQNVINFQSWLTRQSEIMNANQLFKTHTLTMSVVFFKAVEILEEYKTFLHFRCKSEKYKDITRYFDKVKSHIKFEQFTKKSNITLIPRKLNLTVSNKPQTEDINEVSNSKKDWSPDFNISKKIKGLDAYFTSETLNKPLEVFSVDGNQVLYVHRNAKEFINLKKQKFNCSNYLNVRQSMDEND